MRRLQTRTTIAGYPSNCNTLEAAMAAGAIDPGGVLDTLSDGVLNERGLGEPRPPTRSSAATRGHATACPYTTSVAVPSSARAGGPGRGGRPLCDAPYRVGPVSPDSQPGTAVPHASRFTNSGYFGSNYARVCRCTTRRPARARSRHRQAKPRRSGSGRTWQPSRGLRASCRPWRAPHRRPPGSPLRCR